jgi:hypothetical protein
LSQPYEGLAELAFLKFRAEPIQIPLAAHHVHDAGIRGPPRTKALPVAIPKIDNPARANLLIGQSGTALLYKRERASVPARAQRGGVVRGRDVPTCSCRSAASGFARRFVVNREPATAIWSR